MDKLFLSFYGFGIEIKSHSNKTLENIKMDFSYFVVETTTPKIFFEIFDEHPPYADLPPLKASLYTPRNICYTQNNLSFIDYFGKGLIVIDKKINSYKIYCPDPDLRNEMVYLAILSLAGQHFDSNNIHRVHGLGLEINGKAVLILLPSGGGKTTLLLEAFKNESVKMMSEDSPLIDKTGKILPFPLRIGIDFRSNLKDIPEKYLRLVKRMEFEPKYLVDLEYFKDKISTKPLMPKFIFKGVISLGKESSIMLISKYEMLKAFITNSVVGIGLYQGLEFLLQKSIFELFSSSGVIFSRFKNSCKIISRSKTYSFILGMDPTKNLDTLLDFISAQQK